MRFLPGTLVLPLPPRPVTNGTLAETPKPDSYSMTTEGFARE